MAKQLRVFLDDTRPAPDSAWTLVKTADEAIALLETNEVELLSLDHDLAFQHYAGVYVGPGVPKTGYDVTLWLKQKVETDPTFRMPVVRLHTWNPVGRANMEEVLAEIRELLLERELTG